VPDDTHITFHLESPTGDFLYRLAMPATYPQPKEVAGCFDSAGGYGSTWCRAAPTCTTAPTSSDISGGLQDAQAVAGINPTRA
jgi:hypothetical protein